MQDHATTQLRFWRGIVLGWTLLLIVLAGWLIIGFPHPPDGDSVWFLPQMLSYKKSGELINTYVGVNYSPFHDGRFIWHGFLFPVVGSWFMPQASYEGVSIAQFFLEAITLILAGVLLSRRGPSHGSSALALLGLLLVLATWLGGFCGRPDLLVCAWSMLGTLGYCLAKSSRARTLIAGVTIGLVAATSPLPSLFLLVLFFGVSAARLSWRPCLVRSALAGSLALLVFASAFLIYPYHFAEWISGVMQHGKYSEGPRHGGLSGFFLAWFVNFEGSQPLIIFWCAPPVLWGVWTLWRKKAAWPPGVMMSLGAGLLLVVTIAPDARNYNVSSLLPVFFIPWLGLLAGDFPGKSPGIFRRTLPWVVIAAALVTALPFFRDLLIRPHVRDGLTRADAIQLVNLIRKEHPRMEITSGLFSLFDNPTGIQTVIYVETDRPAREEIFLVQQINPYHPVPPAFTHYRLLKSYFGNFAPLRLAGLKMANSPRDYNFAVYERLP